MSVQTTVLPFEIESDGPYAGVVTITLDQPGRPVVVLDYALLRSLDATLDAMEAQIGDDLAGLVLASAAPRAFVAGANLTEIMDLDDQGLAAYLEFGASVFHRIAMYPVTSVAAIHSTVLGGGLELAMHCDFLLGAEPGEREYQVGLPEAGLSICPGWGGTNLLPARMDAAEAIRLTATGQTLKTRAAHEAGILSELVPAERLLERAKEVASISQQRARVQPLCISDSKRIEAAHEGLEAIRGALPQTQAAQAVLSCVEVGLEKGWRDALELERTELIRLRNSEEGRAAITAFFEKTSKK